MMTKKHFRDITLRFEALHKALKDLESDFIAIRVNTLIAECEKHDNAYIIAISKCLYAQFNGGSADSMSHAAYELASIDKKHRDAFESSEHSALLYDIRTIWNESDFVFRHTHYDAQSNGWYYCMS